MKRLGKFLEVLPAWIEVLAAGFLAGGVLGFVLGRYS